MILQIRDLSVQYRAKGKIINAVERVNLDLEAGRILGIVGESGSGKSTLALAILRLIDPPGRITEGEIFLEGRSLRAISERDMQDIRGTSVALVMQNPGTALNPLMTIGDHFVEMIQQHRRTSRDEAIRQTIDMLRSVDLPDQADLMGRYPHQLSGGMKQRVMIGLAMLHRPTLLIADEPTSALDVSTQAQILRLFRDINRKYKTTIVIITHNLGVAAEISDEIAVMYAGKIVEHGRVEPVFDRPAHPYTRGLMRAVPRLTDQHFPAPVAGELTMSNRPVAACLFHPRCQSVMEICKQQEPGAYIVDERKVYCFLYEEDRNG